MLKLAKRTILLTLIMIICLVTVVNAREVSLEFWTFVSDHADYYNFKAVEFDQLHSEYDFKLNLQVFPWDQMHDKLNIALQSGVGEPDLVDIEISKVATVLSREDTGLLGLNSLVEKYQNDLVMSRFTPYSKAGTIYGIPTHIGTGVIFYNTELFEKAGVEIDSIKTWSDYVAAGKKLTKDIDGDGQIDQWMTPVCRSSAWPFHMMARQLGSDMFSKSSQLIIDRPENIKVLKFMQDLVYKDKIGEVVGHYEEPTFYQAMNQGRYASLLPMPAWQMSRFTGFMPDLSGKIAVRPIPAWQEGGSRSAMGGGTMTAITKKAADVEIAKEFLAYAKLTTQVGIDIWTKLNFDPIIKSAYADQSLQAPLSYFNNEPVLNTINSLQSDIEPLYITDLYPRANNILQSEVIFEVIEQQADPAQSLQAAKEKIINE